MKVNWVRDREMMITPSANLSSRWLRREAAADSSQGQARSAPPLDQFGEIVRRPERAPAPFLRTPSGCAELFRFFARAGAPTRLPLATVFHAFGVVFFCSLVAITSAAPVTAQTRTYPKEIRGYKVERAAVELKSKDEKKSSKRDKSINTTQDGAPTNQKDDSSSPTTSDIDELITFGRPSLARVTPLGITFDVPVVVAPIKQSGHVDFLLFEDMRVNEHSVEIDEYHRAFDLPTKKPLTLREPLRFYVYSPVAALAAVDEWSNSRETWPVTGRVYVCGKYKKFLFTFKRCVPVELNVAMRNPLRG